ncbi:MAG: hypothetical protein HF308_19185, partial [Ignavibacteria bacterium]|nr:hypothetical protein [Ignavibacteria bacterium]MCU7526605.1 hypothetical protein [Ignavibacteria bacterium]
ASSDNKLDFARDGDLVEYGEDYLKVHEEKGNYYITYYDYKKTGWYTVELQKTYPYLEYDPANITALYKKVGQGLIRYEVKA